MSDLITRAEAFAAAAHTGQLRKYTGEPYTVHLAAVADLVRTVPHTDAMLAAALLHDAVEDTPTSIETIRAEFGEEVAALVADLTDVSTRAEGNRAARKALDRAHLAAASPEVQTIKLADLIDNTRSIAAHDPGFAKVYLAEKALLLDALSRGDPVLWSTAWKMLPR